MNDLRDKANPPLTTDGLPAGADVAAVQPSGASGDVFALARRTRANRDARGQWVPGNLGAVTHGEHSAQRLTLQEADVERLVTDTLAALSLSRTDATPMQLEVAATFAEATLLRRSAFSRMAALGGPLTSRDRRRATFDVWREAGDRATRHAQTLGLERRQRDVSNMSALEWLEAHAPQDAPQDTPARNSAPPDVCASGADSDPLVASPDRELPQENEHHDDGQPID